MQDVIARNKDANHIIYLYLGVSIFTFNIKKAHHYMLHKFLL